MRTKKPTKSALNKMLPKKADGGKRKTQIAAKSKAASAGWETRRANAIATLKSAQDQNDIAFVRLNMAMNAENVQPQIPVGTITGLAAANEASSLDLGIHVASLYNRLRVKLTGIETPIEPGKEKTFSASALVGSLERTRENIEWVIKTFKDIDDLQEVNL